MKSFSSSSFYSPLGQQIGSSQSQTGKSFSSNSFKDKVAANLEQTHEPRGDTSKGGKIKASKPGNNTLHCIFTKQRELFDKGQECINDFVSKNVSWELQKAIAIQAMTTLNKGIVDAAKFAATTTGFSHEVIRWWAFGYFTAISEYPGSVDNLDLQFTQIHSNAYRKGEPNHF